jgi:hypothetical protein
MSPARGVLFVRHVETADQLPGGRILLPASVQAALTQLQMTVVDVGLPVVCEDQDCGRRHGWETDKVWTARVHPVDVAPGDWVVVKPRSLRDLDGSDLQCCGHDDVLAVLRITGAEEVQTLA